jgi:hypothetical protein
VSPTSGPGPGEITPDGCAVDFYALLPVVGDEVGGIRRIIRSADRAGSRVDLVVEYQVGDRTWTHAFSPHQIGAAGPGDQSPTPARSLSD